MSLITSDDANYTAIANAIRGKLGVQTTYKPGDMAAAIAAIPTGGNNFIDFEVNANDDVTAVIYKSATDVLPDRAFANTSTLTVIRFPAGLEYIRRYALMNCGFTVLELPDGILSIEVGAFKNNTGLAKLYIPSSVLTIDATASNSPVAGNTVCEIYTDATQKPDGWSEYFDNISADTKCPVHYGVSRAEFRGL